MENIRFINKKKFRVISEEVIINKSMEKVWKELSGNFVNCGDLAKSNNFSNSIAGKPTTGLGAERYLNIDFKGKTVEAKERIIDFKENENHCEYTYEVYETKGSPIGMQTYFTWGLSKIDPEKTRLITKFIFKANFSFLSGLFGLFFKKSGSLRSGVLTVKHYLETGEKKVDDERLFKLYPL